MKAFLAAIALTGCATSTPPPYTSMEDLLYHCRQQAGPDGRITEMSMTTTLLGRWRVVCAYEDSKDALPVADEPVKI